MKVLDVGCGAGAFIADLRKLGYQAQGIDPFVPSDIEDAYGTRVRRKTLEELEEVFDVVLLLHSLEHMSVDALAAARKRLVPSGLCVVRIPVVNWAWKYYGTNWVQLDAPRHLILHTIGSFRTLAEQSGFRVEQTVFDSVDLQFWGSEAYASGRSLTSAHPPRPLPRLVLRLRAMVLNRKGLGDQAQFYLRAI